ncbi:hypothetical protein FA95DRAFT_1554566 [Auriscalpium vulgare]|uniref:Uncharacterized protein n=1 Tax=Auriscalpium vulgare TaxID=40419 RepID=A0ACB8S5P3_9AGAM|nr:hypothetical protein FA95DRAFT_1554566 [Auriscalpium vulgare]
MPEPELDQLRSSPPMSGVVSLEELVKRLQSRNTDLEREAVELKAEVHRLKEMLADARVAENDRRPARKASSEVNFSLGEGGGKFVIKKRESSPSHSNPLDALPHHLKAEVKDEDGRPVKKRKMSMKVEVVIQTPSSRRHARRQTGAASTDKDMRISQAQPRDASRANSPELGSRSPDVIVSADDEYAEAAALQLPSASSRPQSRNVKAEPMDDVLPAIRQQTPLDDIKPKIKEDHQFDAATVLSRLKAVGAEPYDIGPGVEITEFILSREFISWEYGGSGQTTFPSIAQDNIDRHGLDDFMCITVELHPHAPLRPGHAGLWLSQEPGRSRSMGTVRLLVGLAPKKWIYAGQYKLTEVEPLSPEEWLLQRNSVRRSWCADIKRYGWGIRVRIRVIHRRDEGRELSDEEVEALVSTGDKFSNVEESEIMTAFDKGEQMLGMYAMKCVGYDRDFQNNNVTRHPVWLAEKKTAVRKKTAARKKTAGKAKKVTVMSKKTKKSRVADREEIGDDEESDGDVEVLDELRFLAQGTKSRPRNAAS